jgi:hypothetical protein
MYLFNQQFFRSNVFMRNFGRIAGNLYIYLTKSDLSTQIWMYMSEKHQLFLFQS